MNLGAVGLYNGPSLDMRICYGKLELRLMSSSYMSKESTYVVWMDRHFSSKVCQNYNCY